MKKLLVATLVLAASVQAVYGQQFHLDQPITDFAVQDLKGRPLNYRALKGKVTVVMFFSTRCPISNAFNFRRNTIYREFKDRVKFIVVDSNSNESREEVRAYAHDTGFDFPVYLDPKNEVSDRFGVLATTDTFVMDSTNTIRYHGYIEDALNPERTTKRGLRLAIESLLAAKPVEMAESRARGCAVRHSNHQIDATESTAK
jgi:peroxiredoxin